METNIVNFKNINKIPENSVLAFGHFSTIHAGHLRYLKYAKQSGDKLIISLLADDFNEGKQKYPFSQKDRAEALSLLSIADYILMMEDQKLKTVVEIINPELIVLGKEFENTKDSSVLDAIKLQISNNNKVEFHGEIHYASAELLINSESELSKQRERLLLEKCKKRKC